MNYDKQLKLVGEQSESGEILDYTYLQIVPDEKDDCLHVYTADINDGYAQLSVQQAVELRDWLNGFIGDAAELAWNPDEVARDAFMAVVNPNTCTAEDDTSGSDDA